MLFSRCKYCRTIWGRDIFFQVKTFAQWQKLWQKLLIKLMLLALLILLPPLLITAIGQQLILQLQAQSAQIGETAIKDINIEAQMQQSISDWKLIGSAQDISYKNINLGNINLLTKIKFSANKIKVFATSLNGLWQGFNWNSYFDYLILQKMLKNDLQIIENSQLTFNFNGKNTQLKLKQNNINSTFNFNLSMQQLMQALNNAGLQIPIINGATHGKLTLFKKDNQWNIFGDLKFDNFNWQSADALTAFNNLTIAAKFTIVGNINNWHLDFAFVINNGEFLVSSFYKNIKRQTILNGNLQMQNNILDLRNLNINDKNIFFDGALQYDINAKKLLSLAIYQLSGDFNTLIDEYLQTFIDNKLKTSGSFYIAALWQHDELQNADVVLNNIDIVDNDNKFAIKNLDGQFGLGDTISNVNIQQFSYGELVFAASKASFLWRKKSLQLLKPFKLPVAGGAIVIEKLSNLGDGKFHVKARIEPIDLYEITKKLKLVQLDGTISGDFPEIEINKNEWQLNQAVTIDVFNGKIAIEKLFIKDLFSAMPFLKFDLKIDGLDLLALTHAFQIGKISGNLQGKIQEMLIINWKPVSFDATIKTDTLNPGKRKISHEAVRYLSSAGGGNAFISKFIKILNEFPYQFLGVHAILKNDVLYLDGMQNAANGGFYLLKGSGLPRIDIIGFERRVNWQELIHRLQSATNAKGAVIMP